MQRTVTGLLLFLMLFLTVSGCATPSLDPPGAQEPDGQPATGHRTDKDDTGTDEVIYPEDEDVFRLVQEAHSAMLSACIAAFEAELAGNPVKDWAEVRPVLLRHFSRRMTDNHLADFYKNSLGDWGYEMMFAFPLAEPEMIISMEVEVRHANTVSLTAVTVSGYDEPGNIRHTLIMEDGRWVIDQ